MPSSAFPSYTRWPRATLVPCVAFVLLLLGSTLTATAASGAPVWRSPADLTGNALPAINPQVAVAPQGQAIAVWERFGVVQAASRPVDSEAWLPTVDLGRAGSDHAEPQVAFSAHGDAIAVWRQGSSYHHIKGVVQAAFRPATTGIWQAPVVLSSADEDAQPARLAMDSAGNAIAVWATKDGNRCDVQVAMRTAATGIWTAPRVLAARSAAQFACAPVVAMDGGGIATAAWVENDGLGPVDTLKTATWSASTGAWQMPVTVPTGRPEVNRPAITTSSSGDALLTWSSNEAIVNSSTFYRVEAAFRPAGSSTWSARAHVSPDGIGANRATTAWDPTTGNAIVVWRRGDSEDGLVQAAHFERATQTWGPPVAIAGPTTADTLRVAFDASGNAVVVYAIRSGASDYLTLYSAEAVVRTRDGIWHPSVRLSRTGVSWVNGPQVAFDAVGNGVAVWPEFDGRTPDRGPSVFAASYDATSRAFDLLDIDSVAPSGRVSFSWRSILAPGQPFLTTPTWSFGDGATAIASRPIHTYARPGTYRVTVSVRDVLASIASMTRTITIGPATGARSAPKLTAKPQLTRLRQTHRVWRLGRKAARVASAKRHPVGTSFTVHSDRVVRLRYVFKRCAPQRRKQSRRACSRTRARGTISVRGRAGKNRLHFYGRLSKKRKLTPGTYVLEITGRASTGPRSNPTTVRFTIAH